MSFKDDLAVKLATYTGEQMVALAYEAMIENLEDAKKAIEILQKFENGQNASIIGKVSDLHLQKVILNSAWGTKRFLDVPTGELLPRIC